MRPRGSGYRADIDGLRAIAVSAVILFHAYPWVLGGGFIGVDIFFTISGFLISQIISRKLDEEEFYIKAFYAARVNRLYPLLITVLLVTFAAGWIILLADAYSGLGRQIAAAAVSAANLLFWHDTSYFSPDALELPLLHLWSLGVEEQFYLVWPLMLIAAYRLRWNRMALAGLIGACSFTYSVWLTRHDPAAAFYSPFSRAWELMIGAFVAFYPRKLGNGTANICSISGLLIIFLGFFVTNQATPFPGYAALFPCIGTCLIIYGRGAWLNSKVLSNKTMVFIGLTSYSLYLWHWPILSFATILNYNQPPRGIVKISLIITAALVAIATYYLIDGGAFVRRRLTAGYLFVVMIVIGGIGVIVAFTGLPGRSVNQDPRRRFVAAYAHLHRTGLGDSYRFECDFRDPVTGRAHALIAKNCTDTGARRTVFLWGDSHAQALSAGLRAILPRDVKLAQVATSGCRPDVVYSGSPGDVDCLRSSGYAISNIRRIKPQIVVLAQRQDHDATDWESVSRFLHSLGVKYVILAGPAPEWTPSLPDVVAEYLWRKDVVRTNIGVNKHLIDVDKVLKDKFQNNHSLIYVSLDNKLCNGDDCLFEVPGHPKGTLMAVDYGHLSPAGSRYVGRAILGPVILPLLR